MRHIAEFFNANPRKIGRAVGTSFLAVVALGFGLLLPHVAASQSSKPPIKVGLLSPETGFLSFYMGYLKPGLELALEEVGYKIGGRSIELIMEDTATDPNVALSKAKKLVERDKVDIMLGPTSSANCLAMLEYMRRAGTPWIVRNCSNDKLTQGNVAPNIFRPSYSDSQLLYPPGKYTATELGYKNVIVIGLNYAGGEFAAKAFGRGVEDAGGKMTSLILVTPGTADFAPYVTQLQNAIPKANAISLVLWGSDAIGFIKGIAEFGLKDKLPIVAYGGYAEPYLLSQPEVADAAVGLVTTNLYSTEIKSAENERFWKAYLAKTGNVPSDDGYVAYIGARVMVEALKKVNGNVEDRPALLKALAEIDFMGPAGRFRFDKSHNVIFDMYLQEIRKVGGKVKPVLLKVMQRDVRQP